MALSISWTVRFVIVFSLINLAPDQGATAITRTTVSPTWRVDLRSSIESEPLGLVVGRGRETHGKPRASLWFLDNTRIAVTFVTREGESHLSTRKSSDQTSTLRLRAVLLDAAGGTVKSTLEWPTGTRFAGIVVTHNGGFVIQRGPSFEPILFGAHRSQEVGTAALGGRRLACASLAEWKKYPFCRH
jgi:hypothetical protein